MKSMDVQSIIMDQRTGPDLLRTAGPEFWQGLLIMSLYQSFFFNVKMIKPFLRGDFLGIILDYLSVDTF